MDSQPLSPGHDHASLEPGVREALVSVLIHTRLRANYEETLSAVVFNQTLPASNRKLVRTYKRTLNSQGARALLEIIWQESLSHLDRQLPGEEATGQPLSSYSLAVMLAKNQPTEVSKLYSQIRSISIAAEYFNLLQRRAKHSRRVDLSPTPLLNEFMIALARSDLETIAHALHSQSVKGRPLTTQPAKGQR
jgi:hypothetical protein